MSQRNIHAIKALRRVERVDHKERAVQRIPFHGVMTTKKIVLGQRYLALIGLPFSHTVAAVRIIEG